MANKKFELTGFARFFFAMLFIAPMAYIGASYYNGEDGIQNIKNLIGLGEKVEISETKNTPSETETLPPPPAPSKELINSQVKKLTDELAEKDARVDKLYLENEELKKQLLDKEKELESVKEQLDKIKSAIK